MRLDPLSTAFEAAREAAAPYSVDALASRLEALYLRTRSDVTLARP